VGVWQDDFHELPTGRTGEGLQRCTLSGRLRQGNAQPENGFTRRSDTGESIIIATLANFRTNKMTPGNTSSG
jgi:hypothetical protein